MIARFKKNCHLKRPRLFGQNVIDSQIGGKMIDNAVDATAPTRGKTKSILIFTNQFNLPNEITRPIFGIDAAIITTRMSNQWIRIDLIELTSDENKTNTKSMFTFIYCIFTVFRKKSSTNSWPKKCIRDIEL